MINLDRLFGPENKDILARLEAGSARLLDRLNAGGQSMPLDPSTPSPLRNNNPSSPGTYEKWDRFRNGDGGQGAEPPSPCEALPFTEEFYTGGTKANELVDFIHSSYNLVFDHEKFKGPLVDYGSSPISSVGLDKLGTGPIPNNLPFEYKDGAGQTRKIALSVKLNQRKCFLSRSLSVRGFSYSFAIDTENSKISASLSFYYKNTDRYKQPIPSPSIVESFTISEKYKAIVFSTDNATDFAAFFREAGFEGYDSIEDDISTSFVSAIRASTASSSLTFLYENIPDFAMARLRGYITAQTMFGHLLLLKKRDEDGLIGRFRDTSGAMINCLRAIGDPLFLYNKFKSDYGSLKELFYDLDHNSVIEIPNGPGAVEMPNKLILATLLRALCVLNSYKGYQTTVSTPTFTIGNGYKVDSNISIGDDPFADKYFLRQQVPKDHGYKMTALVPTNKGLEVRDVWQEDIQLEDVGAGGDYFPFEPVFLVDANEPSATPLLVPAMYVKALAHMQEVVDIQKNIRIGADLLGIVLGVLSFGSTNPIFIALATLDVAFTTADLAVVLNEDRLMQTPEGREFIETWNNIAMLGGLTMAGTLVVRSVFKLGAILLGKATILATKKFITTLLLKIVMEINVTNKAYSSIEILKITEIELFTKFVIKSNEVTRLQAEGVFFAKGVRYGLDRGEDLVVINKGEIIVSGTAKEVRIALKDVWKAEATELSKILDEMFSPTGLVKYGQSRLNYYALAFRKSLKDPLHPGNIAVFEFIGKNGQVEKKVLTTLTDDELFEAGYLNQKPHAEEIGFTWLKEQGISDKNVIALYSELEPCMLKKHKCKNQIEAKFPDAKVSFSYIFNNNAIVMKKAVVERAKDLNNFIKINK